MKCRLRFCCCFCFVFHLDYEMEDFGSVCDDDALRGRFFDRFFPLHSFS